MKEKELYIISKIDKNVYLPVFKKIIRLHASESFCSDQSVQDTTHEIEDNIT